MAAQKCAGWCRCNGVVVHRSEKGIARGEETRQKTRCLAFGERAIRWLPSKQQEGDDGQD